MNSFLLALVFVVTVQARPQLIPFSFGNPGSATGSSSANLASGSGGGAQITSLSANAQGGVSGSGSSFNTASASHTNTNGIFRNGQTSNTNAVSVQRVPEQIGFRPQRPLFGNGAVRPFNIFSNTRFPGAFENRFARPAFVQNRPFRNF